MNGSDTHVAAPIDGDRIQRCARCGAELKNLQIRGLDYPVDGELPAGARVVGGGPYPDGALVEMGRTWQTMVLGSGGPTCEPQGRG